MKMEDAVDIKIPLPDIEYQNKFVEKLDKLTNFIFYSKCIVDNYEIDN
jgi:hypothetical protein